MGPKAAADICIQRYRTTAIVAFRLVAAIWREKDGSRELPNTGTFLKRDGKWQAVGWQATKMATESESKK